MKITILGPWGAYPKAGEATAGYLLEHEGEKILIDCGSGVLSRLQFYIDLHELTAVYITHTHYDHIADLGCLQYACLIDTDLNRRTKPLPIYLAAEDRDVIHAYRSMSGSEIISFCEPDTFDIHGLKLSFIKTYHGVFCLAIKAEAGGKTVVYTADTCYDHSFVPFCYEADLLIAETSFYAEFNARNYGHMNAQEVGILGRTANVKKLALTHLPHFGELETLVDEAKAEYEGDVILCHSGLVFSLA
ncbi:ribonuclease Z [compost metagenome]